MMQQIAPLQTDIAAKTPSDISSDMDKQWLGSDSQQQQRYGNGAEFGRALDQQKQESMNQKTTVEREQSASSGAIDKGATDTAIDEINEPLEKSNQDAHSGDATTAPSEQAKVAETSKTSTDDDAVNENTDGVSLHLASIVNEGDTGDDSIDGSAVNWVALVEEAKSLTINSADTAPTNVEPDTPIWDGEIDEMIAIEDTPSIVKKSKLEPIYNIDLPPVQLDAIASGDPEKIAEVAESLLAHLHSSSAIEAIDGDKLKTIPNDLYIQPVADGNIASSANNTDTDALLEESAEAIAINIALKGSEESADVTPKEPGLLSALMIDLVTKSNDQTSTNSADKEAITPLDSPIDSLKDPAIDVVIADVDQSVVTNAAQNVVSEVPVQTPVMKLDISDTNAIKSLIKLDADQQKLVMNDIASRINTVVPEAMSGNQQQSFIAALQAGVEEFSKQLQQGREPGLSIKALIADALGSAEVTPDKVSAQQLSQISSQLSQTLNLTDALRNSLSESSTETLQAARAEQGSVDVASRAESHKQSQLNQMLDKPANILRPEGQNQFAEKIRWIVNARNSFAEIRLDPPDLGSVQVKVSTAGETATVSFVVQSQQARDALDQATPRLREMLAQQGIELGQSSVQQESQQQQEQQQDGRFAQHKGDGGMEEVASDVIEQRATGGVAGGIDFYA